MMNGINNNWGMGNGYGWIIGLFILVIIIGVVVGSFKCRKTDKIKYNSPLDILKVRYAKGEISKDEYDEKRRQIL